MQVIFKANDGTMFESAENCAQYEAKLAKEAKEWEAWGWTGQSTNKTAHAVVVKLPTSDAAAQFLAAADRDDDGHCKGIDEYSRGWYYYDEGAEQYFRIDDAVISVFRSFSAF